MSCSISKACIEKIMFEDQLLLNLIEKRTFLIYFYLMRNPKVNSATPRSVGPIKICLKHRYETPSSFFLTLSSLSRHFIVVVSNIDLKAHAQRDTHEVSE